MLVFATTNQGKLAELAALVDDLFEIKGAADFSAFPEVNEDGETFVENALKKARAVAKHTGHNALADDSGLCVDALSGRPGVQSARYGRDDADRIARLLHELTGVPALGRTAHFSCALALVTQDGMEIVTEGACPGNIALAPRGEQGFGYDPVFVTESGKHMAELSKREKSLISHRGHAFRKMLPHLKEVCEQQNATCHSER